jgi:GNAT superfamily N-acetyltransferase
VRPRFRRSPHNFLIVRLVSADALELPAIATLFNAAFSDYTVPLQLDEAALREHLDFNDVDLESSCIAMEESPVAFALIARRGAAAWVGGMGTAPGSRRRGLGERALVGGLEAATARNCRAAWLEVIAENEPAIRLYRRLGFEVVRDLIVWSLPANGDSPPVSRQVDPQVAHAWIVANRESREPWQRSDESLARIGAAAVPQGLVVERDGEVAAAMVFRQKADTVTALQIAALDDVSAADALLAAAGGERDLRLSNAPLDESPSRALRQLGARPVARQHEMHLRLS